MPSVIILKYICTKVSLKHEGDEHTKVSLKHESSANTKKTNGTKILVHLVYFVVFRV